MPSVNYGNTTIQYTILDRPDLKSHYITVNKENGVILKGKPLDQDKADKLILSKARWILGKLELVRSTVEGEIVTGSRITYLGRRYYAEVVMAPDVAKATVEFNHSRFRILVNPDIEAQPAIKDALEQFFREKAIKQITPRVRKWSQVAGLSYNALKFHKMEKRWGSCTAANNIVINPEVIKLPFSLIDYVIMHELCHTVVKNHSKEFWAELSKHFTNWKELDERIGNVRL